jgi:hypothetical protein
MKKNDLTFVEWLLLNEIGHIALQQQQVITLPNWRGEMKYFPVHMCDPMFETYQPVGHRKNEHGEWEDYSWKEMVNMNPNPGKNGERPGIGWEGRIPFSHNLFFGCAPREVYATIGPSRNLIRAPDGWFSHALFIDENGKPTYYAPGKICEPVHQHQMA